MTELLEKAFAEASKLSFNEQDALADWLIKELQSERCWTKLFADSQNTLEYLAKEALTEHRQGKTLDLETDER